ncbi:MAG: hypothetical protein ACD_20C00357G0010 [uncultured bacterium]|nr:MAG: hypothetical protein ACD_20C00357G0010 [uncultured bacterium]HBH17358.1 hypothetical protein [Cyanobacteria bacterium UBA9579]
MPKETEKKGAELKAGIFIILTLALLIFSILWLRYFAVTPAMSVCARFSDPGPVSSGLPVYYQGVNIGEISKVGFSENYRYTMIYIDIYEKDLKLPQNVYAQVRQEGITGQKYISINYPQRPADVCLVDGSCIEGRTPFGIEDLQDFFERQVKSGRLDRIITNLEQTMKNANAMSVTLQTLLQANKGEINNFFKQGSKAATDISEIAENVNSFVGDPQLKGDIRDTLAAISEAAQGVETLMGDPEIKSNIKETATNISQFTRSLNELLADADIQQGIKSTFGGIGRLLGKAETAIEGFDIGGAAGLGAGLGLVDTISNVNSLLESMDSFVTNLNCYTGDIYSDVKQTGLIPNTSAAFYEATRTFGRAQDVFGKTEQVISRFGEAEIDSDTRGLIIRTIMNTNQAIESHNQAAKQVDCLAEGTSELLSKRFLLLRLLFGKPGAALEECEQLEQYLDGEDQDKIVRPCPVKAVPASPVPCVPTQKPVVKPVPNQEKKPSTPDPVKEQPCPTSEEQLRPSRPCPNLRKPIGES